MCFQGFAGVLFDMRK